jgi:hypothetical protein
MKLVGGSGIMADSHCHSWWKAMLWCFVSETHKVIWLHLFLSCSLFGFAGTDTMVVNVLLFEFSLQSPNCTSKGFSCNFLDLTVRQSPQGLSCDILDKRSQLELQVLKWLECFMFIPISHWLRSWGLSIVNFTDSWDFVFVRSFLSSRLSVLLSFWRQKATL